MYFFIFDENMKQSSCKAPKGQAQPQIILLPIIEQAMNKIKIAMLLKEQGWNPPAILIPFIKDSIGLGDFPRRKPQIRVENRRDER